MPKPKKEEKKDTAAPATLIVNLPADATLMIDGYTTTSTAARRVFESPALEVGKVYQYTLQAIMDEDVRTKTVIVRAGEEFVVSFDFTEALISQ